MDGHQYVFCMHAKTKHVTTEEGRSGAMHIGAAQRGSRYGVLAAEEYEDGESSVQGIMDSVKVP